MKLLSDAQIALHLVSDEEMKKTGAIGEECEDALEESLYLPTVKMAILIKENADLTFKVSLRSDGRLNSSKIASKYNGGGHKLSAGFEVLKENFEDIKNEIIKGIPIIGDALNLIGESIETQ